MLDRATLALRSRPWLFAAALSICLIIANIVAQSSFATPSGWPELLAALAPLALVAFAATPAILSGGGGLDLSVGPLAVFVNVLLVQVLFAHGVTSAWACIPILLDIGTAVGALNGFLVSYLRYVPVIATLCTFFVLSGVNTQIGQNPRLAGHNWTTDLGNKIGPAPGALVLLVIAGLIWYALSRTSFHRSLYATGGNDVTAFSAGVNVQLTRVIAYALGGFFTAFGGSRSPR